MKIRIMATIGAAAFLVQCTASLAITWPEAKITVRAEGDDGKPVEGASVRIGFEPTTGNRQRREGVTDGKGVFEITTPTAFRISAQVSKTGYYKSESVYEYDLGQVDKVVPPKWEPYNAMMNVIFRKIINPIPMYALKARIEVPVVGTPVGFDLAVGDWVAPHGRGKVSDLVFTLERRFVSKEDYSTSLHIGFTNKGDGIQDAFASANYGSELRLPHQAPEGKYVDTWCRTDSYPYYPKVRPDQNYFFRVRTVLDEKGEVKSAIYGKIYGEIRYDVINSKTAVVLFTYYLNPTPNDRNVEFDVKRNLFTGLKGSQAIKNP
jgi:hypothetical protein